MVAAWFEIRGEENVVLGLSNSDVSGRGFAQMGL